MNDAARLEIVEPGEVTRARLRGELDMSNARQVGISIAAAVPNGATGLILDLTELAFIDSAGIRTLLSLVGRFAWHGQKLTFVAAPGSPVRRAIGARRRGGRLHARRNGREDAPRPGRRRLTDPLRRARPSSRRTRP